jgi:hypothetical protein
MALTLISDTLWLPLTTSDGSNDAVSYTVSATSYLTFHEESRAYTNSFYHSLPKFSDVASLLI